MNWYNDNEPFAGDVIESNIGRGRLPAGVVDRRSIADVRPDELVRFDQCHFFAGIGGMPYGLRLAGWPDDLAIWTGGFPCQDISVAGRGEGLDGARSGLWWTWFTLIDACRPARLLIENVPALRTRGADDVLAALEGIGYACRAQVVGAEHVGAPHKRHRVWIVADRSSVGFREREQRPQPIDGSQRTLSRDEPDRGGEAMADRPRGRQRADGVASGGGDAGHADIGGAGVVHPAGPGLEGHGPDAGQPEGCESRGAGVSAVADAEGRGAVRLPAGPGAERITTCDVDGAGEGHHAHTRWDSSRWPSRPGEPQHEWEPPRLLAHGDSGQGYGRRDERHDGNQQRDGDAGKEVELQGAAQRALGVDAYGLSRRLARWNKAGLKAVGNAVVPQVVAEIASAWLKAMTSRHTQPAPPADASPHRAASAESDESHH